MQGIGDGYDLTPRARELLVFLSGREACPTFEEMRRALGLGSKSGVVRLLGQLEGRGYVRRRKGCERAIVVLRGVGEAGFGRDLRRTGPHCQVATSPGRGWTMRGIVHLSMSRG